MLAHTVHGPSPVWSLIQLAFSLLPQSTGNNMVRRVESLEEKVIDLKAEVHDGFYHICTALGIAPRPEWAPRTAANAQAGGSGASS